MALAIFDLDDTLIHGDSASLWSREMMRLGWVEDCLLYTSSVLLSLIHI